MIKPHLLVFKTQQLKALHQQYQALGLVFEYHQHGNGPYHYSTEVAGLVLELYPSTKTLPALSGSLRVGFTLPNLAALQPKLLEHGWMVKQSVLRNVLVGHTCPKTSTWILSIKFAGSL